MNIERLMILYSFCYIAVLNLILVLYYLLVGMEEGLVAQLASHLLKIPKEQLPPQLISYLLSILSRYYYSIIQMKYQLKDWWITNKIIYSRLAPGLTNNGPTSLRDHITKHCITFTFIWLYFIFFYSNLFILKPFSD